MGKNLDTLLQKLEKLDDERTPGEWRFFASLDKRRGTISSEGAYLIHEYFPDSTGLYTQKKYANAEFTAAAVNSNKVLREVIRIQREALDFYSTFSPRYHPDGHYEIHIARGEGGEVRFGTKARQALEAVEKLIGEGLE